MSFGGGGGVTWRLETVIFPCVRGDREDVVKAHYSAWVDATISPSMGLGSDGVIAGFFFALTVACRRGAFFLKVAFTDSKTPGR
jgi:hypothetical protein